MERRKDTGVTGVKLPGDFIRLIEDVFNKNFAKKLLRDKKSKEAFVVFGEIFPDEIVVGMSLKNPASLRLTTCYASVDYPPASSKPESGKKSGASVSESVQTAVNLCVDALASFFQTFFDEGRPVDYDTEYRQDWTVLELEPRVKVFLRVNHDNLELEAQADAILEMDEEVRKKRKLH